MEDYFSKHYALINRIDLNSEESIRRWYDKMPDIFSQEFLPYTDSLENKSILELGCGIGGFLYFLKKKGITDFLGVDQSKEQLSICKKYVTDQVVNDDVLNFLSKNDNEYDLIVLYDLIEHLNRDSIIKFVKLLYKSLNVGGQVILRTPNMGSLFGLRSRYIDFTHEVGFTEESIMQVFIQAGFSKLQVRNTYIGKKRFFAVKCYQRLLEKLYNISLSKVVTQNLVLIAVKDN